MTEAEVFTKFGKFLIAPAKEVYGELRVAGRDTSLYLYLQDNEHCRPQSVSDGCVTGTLLHDLMKVTLIQCVMLEGPIGRFHDGAMHYYARLFPHFVLEGQRHLAPHDSTIFEISFVLEDATALFYDFDAFGTVLDAVPHIEQIVLANPLDRPIPIGPEPQIMYFAGKRDIIEVDTILGKVSARHNPGGILGGPHGVRIDNAISVSLEPKTPVVFGEAITQTLRLLRFLELIIGRPQNIRALTVYLDGEHREPLKVYWSLCPSRPADSTNDRRSPAPSDLPLNPIERSEEFARVLRVWLETDEERQDARQRFQTAFAHQHRYSVERLVGAANMFDILPKSAAPTDTPLSNELQDAKQRGQEIFKALPDSYERSSILSALGRLGHASLKHKTRHRASYIVNAIGEYLSDLVSVLDAAIDCRNHYVHGSESKIDCNENPDMLTFFTNTLEFVFAASELTEAGWDIQAFMNRSTSMAHPFGAYRVNYRAALQAFKVLQANP